MLDMKIATLADMLNADDPRLTDAELTTQTDESADALLDITEPTEFCKKILESREFRQYILNGIVLGDLPPAVMCRIIDHAWGKPAERVEHTGKDGSPIQTVTEVRRVIVHARDDAFAQLDEDNVKPARTH